jgi:homoserine kinase type II
MTTDNVKISPAAVGSLLRRNYGLRLEGEPQVLEGGEDNLNLRVPTEREDFVLRRYDACGKARAARELEFVNELVRRQYPTPRPVPRLGGGWVASWRGRPAALFRFVPGAVPPAYDEPLATALGALLGRLHTISRSLSVKMRRENDLHELERALGRSYPEQLGSVYSWKQTVADFLRRHGGDLKGDLGRLAWGIIHHDLHRFNVLAGKGSCGYTVLDFGEACTAPFFMDIVRTFHYLASEAADYRLPETLKTALLSGYETHSKLSSSDKEKIPVFFDMINLADASRFLAEPQEGVEDISECRSFQIYLANRSGTASRANRSRNFRF